MRYLLLAVGLLSLTVCVDPRGASSVASQSRGAAADLATDSAFAGLVERLSEPGGYFDTDNLISNETSYLHVVGKMREMGVSGGAYIGVGPDQNFSYIAQVRPSIAFIIDIRRDNLLQHLMFKSLFSLSRNRIEHLCLLFARPFPDDVEEWDERSLLELVDYIDGTAADSQTVDAALAAVASRAASFGLPLSEEDLETIRRFHYTFIREGLGLRFRSHGRLPRPYYPTYRRLLLETDLSGRQTSYLAGEEGFRFVKSLQDRNLIIPVVGDLGGDHALAAIAVVVAERGLRVSAFYTSNVEFYLMRDGGFDRFVANVAQLPYDDNSVIIRSYFGRSFGFVHPQAVRGYYSVQLLQTIESLVNDSEVGAYRSYLDLVTRHSLDLR
jgi:hypothetical protein